MPPDEYDWMTTAEAIERIESIMEAELDGADHERNIDWILGRVGDTAFPVRSCDQDAAFSFALGVVALRKAIAALRAPDDLRPQASYAPERDCADDVCQAAKRDGILCADGECDYHAGIRKPPEAMPSKTTCAPAKDPAAAIWHAGQMALYRRLEMLAAGEGRDAGLIAEMHFKADMHQRAAMALAGVGAEAEPAPSFPDPLAVLPTEPVPDPTCVCERCQIRLSEHLGSYTPGIRGSMAWRCAACLPIEGPSGRLLREEVVRQRKLKLAAALSAGGRGE